MVAQRGSLIGSPVPFSVRDWSAAAARISGWRAGALVVIVAPNKSGTGSGMATLTGEAEVPAAAVAAPG